MLNLSARALWLVPCFCLGAVIADVASRTPLPPLGPGTPASRERVALIVRMREADMRREALERFPGDPWSQGDHFGSQESKLVRRLASEEGLRPGAVLDAIDRDLKAFPGGGERGWVPACMPRAFYD